MITTVWHYYSGATAKLVCSSTAIRPTMFGTAAIVAFLDLLQRLLKVFAHSKVIVCVVVIVLPVSDVHNAKA